MNADQTQQPLSLPVFLLLLGIVLAVCAATLLVERHCVSVASTFGTPTSFYDGTPGRRTITCPDCGLPADELFADHGGQCLNYLRIVPPTSALGLIRKHALTHRRFSSNDIRAALDAADIAGPKRGPAFAAAEKKQWIERDGYERSTDTATKGHPVAVYQSLIYKPGRNTQ